MTLLILSGTSEAREIAQSLATRGIDVVASLAGVTRAPRSQDVPTRIGGFGGAAGFRDFVAQAGITAVLDATHPFAAAITSRTAQICRDQSIAHAIFQRPGWRPNERDLWHRVPSEEAVAALVAPGSVVFLATGRQTLDRFHDLSHCKLICRQIDPPEKPFPFENGVYLIGKPPFSAIEEEKLFHKHKVDWLVVKDAGGQASFSKLEAARELRLPVAMIDRPALPRGVNVLNDIETAIDWGAQHG